MIKIHLYKPHGPLGVVARILGALSPFHPFEMKYSHVAVEAEGFVFSMSFAGLDIHTKPEIPGTKDFDTIVVHWPDGEEVFMELMDIYDRKPRFRWHGLLELWFDVAPRKRPHNAFICTDIASYALGTYYGLTPDDLALILE